MIYKLIVYYLLHFSNASLYGVKGLFISIHYKLLIVINSSLIYSFTFDLRFALLAVYSGDNDIFKKEFLLTSISSSYLVTSSSISICEEIIL